MFECVRQIEANLQVCRPSGNQTESENFVVAGAAHFAFDEGAGTCFRGS